MYSTNKMTLSAAAQHPVWWSRPCLTWVDKITHNPLCLPVCVYTRKALLKNGLACHSLAGMAPLYSEGRSTSSLPTSPFSRSPLPTNSFNPLLSVCLSVWPPVSELQGCCPDTKVTGQGEEWKHTYTTTTHLENHKVTLERPPAFQ